MTSVGEGEGGGRGSGGGGGGGPDSYASDITAKMEHLIRCPGSGRNR